MKIQKYKLNRKGFSHFELALLTIVLAAISAAGFYVYSYNNNKSNALCTNIINCKKGTDSTETKPNIIDTPAAKPRTPAKTQTPKSTPTKTGTSTSTSSGSSSTSRATAPVPTNWSLSSRTNGSRDYAYAGTTVGFFQDITNNGPATATYEYKVEQSLFDKDFHHKDGGWTVIRGAVKASVPSGSHQPSLTRGDTNFLNTTGTIPTNADTGDQFCQRLVYTKHDGPSSSSDFTGDANWKSGCVKVKKWYPHNYPTLTRVLHGYTKGGPLYNYDAWWSDKTKTVLIVQMRVSMPANSPYTPANFRAEVKDGAKQLAYFRISQPVPSSWSNSPKASYDQIIHSKAPKGRYLGEAHIKASDIKGNVLTFHAFYLSDKSKATNNDVYNDTSKVNASSIVPDDKAVKTKWRGWPQLPIVTNPNNILSFTNDNASFEYSGCINKADKNKIDVSVTANIPSNFNHILRDYQANIKSVDGKPLVVLALNNSGMPAGAKPDALDHIKPQPGRYVGVATIPKVSALQLNLFYNTKDASSAKGLFAVQGVNTSKFTICQ